MFSLRVTPEATVGGALDKLLRGVGDLPERLEGRRKMTPADFTDVLARREEHYHSAPYTPAAATADLAPGTYYLTRVDEMRRRHYERKPTALAS